MVMISFSLVSRSRNVRKLACIRDVTKPSTDYTEVSAESVDGLLVWLLHCSGPHARFACCWFAQTLFDLIVSELGCFRDVRLVGLAIRFDQIECLGVADGAEGFEQTGVYAWRVVFFFEKRV